MADTRAHTSEFLEALRKLVTFLEHGRLNYRGPAAIKEASTDITAARAGCRADKLWWRRSGHKEYLRLPRAYPKLHAGYYAKRERLDDRSERGTYEESTFWNPSWTTAKGAVMTTDICDLATSARAIGKGELVSEKSHKAQVGTSLVGLGGLTDKCPKTVCDKQLPNAHYGITTVVLGEWILQNPLF